MKRCSFLLSVSAFVLSGVVAAFAVFVAFANSFYWADRFKDSAQIPDSVQSLLTLSGWVFWGGIAIAAAQIVGLAALLRFKKVRGSETATPNNVIEPTPGTARHVS